MVNIMLNVLVADDSKQITSILSEYIKKEGYNVVVANDGEQALKCFKKDDFNMVLLDVVMPKKDGFEICKEIRKTSTVPIIMITGKNEDHEKIMGLTIGADDYVIKPFSPNEVIARIKAIMRRMDLNMEKTSKCINFDNVSINLEKFTVSLNEQMVMLTKKEIEILWMMISNRGKVFTRENLLNSLWGYDYYGDCRTVDSHIKRLRAKLDEHNHENWDIKTVWGLGYKFEVYIDEL